MEKLIESIKKELNSIGEKGLNTTNLEVTSKLSDILKDLSEFQKMESSMGSYDRYDASEYRRYAENGYGRQNNGYMRDGYNGPSGDYMRDGYNRPQNEYMIRGTYQGSNSRTREHLDRISEGAELYEMGRDRYQHGGSNEKAIDGLEKMMYAICVFIESAMDQAHSPQEKDVIRRHIQKIKNI